MISITFGGMMSFLKEVWLVLYWSTYRAVLYLEEWMHIMVNISRYESNYIWSYRLVLFLDE